MAAAAAAAPCGRGVVLINGFFEALRNGGGLRRLVTLSNAEDVGDARVGVTLVLV